MNHASSIIKDNLYIFGGELDENYKNDIWKLNLQKHVWTKLDTKGNIPGKRSDMTMFPCDNNKAICMLGG